jgi:hypothetical protein
MFTTSKQATQTFTQQAAAFGLAAIVTLSILASVNGLATTPSPDSLLASGYAQVALLKVAATS